MRSSDFFVEVPGKAPWEMTDTAVDETRLKAIKDGTYEGVSDPRHCCRPS